MDKGTNLTREYIKVAMLELLAKTSAEKISITDLVKRAGVSRTAFYRNYSSKDELIEDLVLELISTLSIFNPMDIYHFSISEWEDVFKGIRSKRKEINLITKASVENISILNHNAILPKEITKRNMAATYQEAAIRGATNHIITKWILSDMKESDKEMAKITYQIFHKE